MYCVEIHIPVVYLRVCSNINCLGRINCNCLASFISLRNSAIVQSARESQIKEIPQTQNSRPLDRRH